METIGNKIENYVGAIVITTILMVLFIGAVIYAAFDITGILAMVIYAIGACTVVTLLGITIHHICNQIVDLVKAEIFNRELMVLEEISNGVSDDGR